MKYIVPDRMVDNLLDLLTPFTETDPYLVKEGRRRTSYPVTSLYFDSYDLKAFFEKEAGQFYRRKIRLRTYEREFALGQPSFLEIKRRVDGVVLKDRLSIPVDTLSADLPVNQLLGVLLSRARAGDSTLNEAQLMRGWFSLQPSAMVRYERLALVARQDRTLRITIDHQLEGLFRPAAVLGPVAYRRLDNINGGGMDGISGRYGILELKSDRSYPAWLHNILQELELMRTAYSKYFLAIAALRPRVTPDCHADFN